jgi:alpha-beta hydrolase superfamily lysophospholipase
MLPIGRQIAGLERWRLGPRGKSPLVQALLFGELNKPFKPARTPFDWLSRDPAEVDRYANDPFCGFIATTQLWVDLLDGWAQAARPEQQARIPKDLAVQITAGMEDPVSKGTKGLARLMAAYRRAGLKRVTYSFYPGARHELFHETNRAAVTRDLMEWLDEL